MKDLFTECGELTMKAFEAMRDAVVAYVDEDYAKVELQISETISFEKKQDRVKEEFFERLYSRETMVFSRSDRINIIENLDTITDKTEIVARKLGLYRVKVNENLRDGIKELAELNYNIGVLVYELTINLQNDFAKAKENIVEITNLRREVREKHWILQKLNYEYQKEFHPFRYTETLIKYLMETADKSEIFADRMFILINKYTQ